MLRKTIKLLYLLILAGFSALLISCSENHKKDSLLITVSPLNMSDPDFLTGESWRFIPGSKILEINSGKHSTPQLLTGGFYSACSPDVSYDGKKMLFAGQEKQGDKWQIWEMELSGKKYRRVTQLNENCTDPSYLPGEMIVFSKLTVNDTVKTSYSLFTCKSDGSALRQITFSPDAHFATTVLKDGRLLEINRQLLPVNSGPFLMVMRPDGTKADMFYNPAEGSTLISSPEETGDGKIVFVESPDKSGKNGELVSINYNRPLHTRSVISSEIQGDFHSVVPVDDKKYLVSYRKSGSDPFSLYSFDVTKKILGELIYADPGYNVTGAVNAREYERPRKLPSEVDHLVKTGLLLCQDINFPDLPKAGRIEVLGIDTTYGVLQVEKDGSFYLKVMADKPFRIRSIDENGNPTGNQCSWLWLRPNERRGCVGCHENPELVPDNREPLAIRKNPVIIPVHITRVNEKIVELE